MQHNKWYQKFYSVADLLTDELQEHNWLATGKLKRRLKGNDLIKLRYSVECILRDCIAVVLHRRRKGEASIHLGQHHYGANRPDKLLMYQMLEIFYMPLIALNNLYVSQHHNVDAIPTSIYYIKHQIICTIPIEVAYTNLIQAIRLTPA